MCLFGWSIDRSYFVRSMCSSYFRFIDQSFVQSFDLSFVRLFDWLISNLIIPSIVRAPFARSIDFFRSFDWSIFRLLFQSLVIIVRLFIHSIDRSFFFSIELQSVKLINAFARSFNESIYLRRLVCSLICSVGRWIRLSDCLNTSFICRQRLHNSVAEN